MWNQTRAVVARTCPTLLPGFLASLGHMRPALHLHVEIMGDTITMVETTTVETTMENTIMVGTSMVETTMEDTIMEDLATVVTQMVDTIMLHPAMVDMTMATIVDQTMDITVDPHLVEELNV